MGKILCYEAMKTHQQCEDVVCNGHIVVWQSNLYGSVFLLKCSDLLGALFVFALENMLQLTYTFLQKCSCGWSWLGRGRSQLLDTASLGKDRQTHSLERKRSSNHKVDVSPDFALLLGNSTGEDESWQWVGKPLLDDILHLSDLLLKLQHPPCFSSSALGTSLPPLTLLQRGQLIPQTSYLFLLVAKKFTVLVKKTLVLSIPLELALEGTNLLLWDLHGEMFVLFVHFWCGHIIICDQLYEKGPFGIKIQFPTTAKKV